MAYDLFRILKGCLYLMFFYYVKKDKKGYCLAYEEINKCRKEEVNVGFNIMQRVKF